MPRIPGSGRGPDDMRRLEEIQANRANTVANDINQNIEKHIKWNDKFVDATMIPLTPDADSGFESSSDFRQAMPATEYLPTPPASISEESANEVMVDLESPREVKGSPFRYVSPSQDDPPTAMPSFRRRIGRGGRLMFDRRLPFRTRDVAREQGSADRYRYDLDDEDDNEETLVDEHDPKLMSNCIYLATKERDQNIAAMQQAQARAANSAVASSNSSSVAAT